jgi:tRNA dimethylallyltransferase
MATLAPLIVILGPTASGKTAAGIELAKNISGEIICADSRTIYKGMNIGTAKPTLEERSGIPHHLLDVIELDEKFSVAEFKEHTIKLIDEIWARGNFPIMVGGTGLYIDSILFNFSFGPIDPTKRRELEKMSLDELLVVADEKEIWLGGVNRKNRRHVIRAIERGGTIKNTSNLRDNTLVLGTLIDREQLRKRIVIRIDQMFHDGLIEETVALTKKYDLSDDAPHTTIYKEADEYIRGEKTMEEVKTYLEKRHMDIAKRQMSWFKRNADIFWHQNREELLEQAVQFAEKFKV